MPKKSAALPLVAGAVALGVASSSKKKRPPSRWGVRVSKGCTKVSIVNPKLFSKFTWNAYNELIGIDPRLSLIQVSDALFGEVAPKCSGFPEAPESAEVAELYAIIARAVAGYMDADPRKKDSIGSLIDEATAIKFVDWYRNWRNYPSSEVPTFPDDQVAFSSDLSTYKIGKNWKEETLRPFIQESYDQGRFESSMTDFMQSRNVQFGSMFMPIAELPQEAIAVQSFMDEFEKAFNEVAEEVFRG